MPREASPHACWESLKPGKRKCRSAWMQTGREDASKSSRGCSTSGCSTWQIQGKKQSPEPRGPRQDVARHTFTVAANIHWAGFLLEIMPLCSKAKFSNSGVSLDLEYKHN